MPLHLAKKQVLPSFNELYLRCGVCHGEQFKVFITPVNDAALMRAIECVKCSKVRKIDPQAFVEGTGTVDKREPIKRTSL